MRLGRDGELGQAFRLLSPWLQRRLAGRGAPASDLDDLVQESFLRFARYDVAERVRNPRALLLRIASNLTIDDARRRLSRGAAGRVDVSEADKLAAAVPDPDLLIDLKAAILELPPNLRETFLLARFTPLTNEDVANRLGISTKTVEWRISRAVSICLARLGR